MENHQRFSAFGFFLARFSHGGRDGVANERKDFLHVRGKGVRAVSFACLLRSASDVNVSVLGTP
jgi:hypothetical protein